jgi:hypothetical protein
MVRVDKQSDYYAVWSKSDSYRSNMLRRADGDSAAVSGLRVDTSNTYLCETYALKSSVSDRARINSKNELDLEKAKIKYLMGQAKLKREELWAADCFATGVWTSNTEQTGKDSGPSTNEFLRFNDSSSIPIDIIQGQMLVVELSTGKLPNVAVMNSKVDFTLRRNDQITDLYKHTSAGIPSSQLVADVMGLKKIVVGRAVKNTAQEEVTASMSRVLGDHILLAYIAEAASPDDATAIGGFAWNGVDAVDATGASVRQWYDEDRKVTWYEAEQSVDFKITGNDFGVFLYTAVA